MSEAPLGVALIGCGGIARHYRAVYAGLPGVAYRLVVDVDAELARHVAETHGVARWSADWREALAEDIHVADISTPNHLHGEQGVTLLDAGKHVLFQTPLARSVDECQAIVAAARRAGKLAGVYMSGLEDPAIWDLREIIRLGGFGTVTGIRARYAHRGGLFAPRSENYWRGSLEKTGGGSFFQLAIHHTNLVSWLLDDKIESVMAYSKNIACPNIGGDDTAVCVAEMATTGALIVFESSWNAEGTCLQIYGTRGSATVFGVEGAAIEARLNQPYTGRALTTDDDGNVRRERIDSNPLRQISNPFNQHVAFLQAVQDGVNPPMPAEASLYDVGVAQTVYVSAAQQRRVPVAEILNAL